MSTHPKIHPGIHTCIHYAYINHLSSIHVSTIHHQFLLPQAALHPSTCPHSILLFILSTRQTLSWRCQRAGQRVTREPSLWGTAFRNLWTVHRVKTTRVSLDLTHLQASPTTQTCAIDEETRGGCTDLQTVQWEELNATRVDALPVYFYDRKHWFSQQTCILTTHVRESQAMGTNTLNSGTKSWHTKVRRTPNAKPLDPRFSDRHTACPVSLQIIQMDRLTHTTSKRVEMIRSLQKGPC